jgi:predicted RecA/RadA family phage recombinase
MADFEVQSAYSGVQAVVGADVDKGDYVLSNEVAGFYFSDYESGDTAFIVTKAEIVKVIKNAGEAWAAGEALYWDASGGNVTNVASTNVLIGYVERAALSAAVVGYMSFDGMAAFLKA